MKQNWKRALRCLAGIAVIAAIPACALIWGADGSGVPEPVRLSRESGFYGEAFALEMDADGREIRYTLDCTPPDAHSTLYTGPIEIGDASANENVYSMIEDVCLELKPEILEGAGLSPKFGFTTPKTPVDKATVVRAVSVDAFGNCSEAVTGIYFVGFDQKRAYDGMGVMSIVTDPDDLFDPETGIYVLGRTFEDSLVDGQVAQPVDPNPGTWPGNYKNRGIQWEREAEISYFDADRNLVLRGNYGIRIQGGASRYMLPKSLNIFARERYGGATIPAGALFGEDWELKSLNLNAGGQGISTKIHDVLSNELAADLNVLTREYVPCQLFLDGEYWGVYWLTPRFKADYFESKYGIDGDDLVVTKVDHVEVGLGEDIKEYDALMDLIGDGDLNDPDTYAAFCERADVDSWVDYYALEIYFANTDWPKNNRSLWRTRRDTGVPLGDGRWRWILFDVNLSMDLKNAAADFVTRTARRDAIFASLLDCVSFRKALYARLVSLAQNEFSPGRVDAFVDDYEEKMAAAMANEYGRFVNTKTEADFREACEDIRAFFHTRHDYIMEKLGEKYG